MTAHADDYHWFGQEYRELMEAYCLTLVRGLTAEETLRRFGAAADRTNVTGIRSLYGPTYEVWDEHEGDRLLLGVSDLGSWSLVVEPNGYLGVTESLIKKVSLGTKLVSHFRNINAVDYFYLVDDGQVRLSFEPLFASRRSGSDPERYVELMRVVGFHVDEQDQEYVGHTEATFALAEEMTNVRLTPDLLNEATFCYSTAPAPR